MDYFSHMFDEIDDSIHLDEEQKKVILSDENRVMVVAGAGSGKTTTMAAKIKYLVEQKNVLPQDILLISYTNQAVEELKKRIQVDFGMDAFICTFHKLGYEILKAQGFDGKILSDSTTVLKQAFFSLLRKKETFQNELWEYFLYEDSSLKGEHWTLKGRLFLSSTKEMQEFEKKRESLLGEVTFLKEEAEIANKLFFNNITYSYQKPYVYDEYYIPDFTIFFHEKTYYLELFPMKKTVSDFLFLERKRRKIRKIHETYGTNLLELNLEGDYLKDLEELLKEHGIVGKKRTKNEIVSMLEVLEKDRLFEETFEKMKQFIHAYRMNLNVCFSVSNRKKELFLSCVKKVYEEYLRLLNQYHFLDFSDMIEKAYERLDETKLTFRYIIVDEYQDISGKRYQFLEKLVNVTKAKLIVVGDDFQSIFSFSGSDISLFFTFQTKESTVLKITSTYRNSQELIEEAGNFVMKNPMQLKKQLRSSKKEKDPIRVYYYEDFTFVFCKVVESLIKEYGETIEILLLGRFHFDLKPLLSTSLLFFDGKELKSSTFPQVSFTFLTVHASKGLGFPHVILLNGKEGIYGFPSSKSHPMELEDVIKEDHSYPYAEERRLFYVALTRTKHTVSILSPIDSVSPFILELYKKKEYYFGTKKRRKNPKCPRCGYPLIRNYWNSKGIEPLYQCVNHQKRCGFETTNLDYKIPIQRCEVCKKGYWIVKEKNDSAFFTCTFCKRISYIKKI